MRVQACYKFFAHALSAHLYKFSQLKFPPAGDSESREVWIVVIVAIVHRIYEVVGRNVGRETRDGSGAQFYSYMTQVKKNKRTAVAMTSAFTPVVVHET